MSAASDYYIREIERLSAEAYRLMRERDEARAERDETYLAGVQEAERLRDVLRTVSMNIDHGSRLFEIVMRAIEGAS